MTQKEKIKHERVLKLKKIGFWTLNIVSYILAGLFLIVLIISLSTPKKQNITPRGVNNLYNEYITEVIQVDSPNNVVYDDVHEKVTLSVDELSYTYSNLTTLFENHLADYTESNVVYNEVYFSPNFADDVRWADGNGNEIVLDDEFSYYVNNVVSEFEYSITIECSNSNYEDISNAIETDISANSGGNETQSIFQSLTNVLTNFITTLNSGITSVLNLFWNSTTSQLTLLGNLTTIVIGVAVCFFLFRLVIGLIRLRG